MMPHKTITIKLPDHDPDRFVQQAVASGLIQENADGDLIAVAPKTPYVVVKQWSEKYRVRQAIRGMLEKRTPIEATPIQALKTIGFI